MRDRLGQRALLNGWPGDPPAAWPISDYAEMFGDEHSAFWFHGRLAPLELIPPFSVSGVRVADDVSLEVAWHGIGVWARPGTRRFKQPGEASNLFRTVVGAWAAASGTALTVSTEGWIEAKNAQVSDSVLGWIGWRRRSLVQQDEAELWSDRMRAACELAVRAHEISGYRLALRDIHSSLLEGAGDDAYVFAYRALEDLARAITNSENELRASDWERLHDHIGQDREEARAAIEPLRLARNMVAHGGPPENLASVNLQRDELLLDARRRVLRALASDERIGIADIPAALEANDSWAVP